MDVYLCGYCIDNAQPKRRRYDENEITNKTFAPWTVRQVESLKAYQRAGEYLPFVCDEHHVLKVATDGMYCLGCDDFRLEWAYPWTLDWTWSSTS
jgi:hypothetical protein